MQVYQAGGIPLALGMEIRYVVTDAGKWEVEPERTAAEFDARYYGKLLEKAWEEVAFVLPRDLHNLLSFTGSIYW